MSNLYSNIVELFKRIIINTKDGGLFIFILLVLITIPFANILNSICIGILFTISLGFFNKNNFNYKKCIIEFIYSIIFFTIFIILYLHLTLF